MSIGFRQIITLRGQNRGRQLFGHTGVVQWRRRPMGPPNFLQQLFINKLEIFKLLKSNNTFVLTCQRKLEQFIPRLKRRKNHLLSNKAKNTWKNSRKFWMNFRIIQLYSIWQPSAYWIEYNSREQLKKCPLILAEWTTNFNPYHLAIITTGMHIVVCFVFFPWRLIDRLENWPIRVEEK